MVEQKHSIETPIKDKAESNTKEGDYEKLMELLRTSKSVESPKKISQPVSPKRDLKPYFANEV